MTSFIHKISKFQGRLSIKISSMGPKCAPTLILAVLQPPNSQSEKPILKPSWHLTACRYHAFFFVKQERKGWGIPGIFGEFLRFSLLGISATQSLAFPSPRDRKVYDKTRWRHNKFRETCRCHPTNAGQSLAGMSNITAPHQTLCPLLVSVN